MEVSATYLESVLKIYFQDSSVKVSEFHQKNGLEDQMNFTSVLYKFQVKWCSEKSKGQENLIIKFPENMEEGTTRKFSTEKMYFSQVKPLLKQLLNQIKIDKQEIMLGPEFYPTHEDHITIIGDLTPEGFSISKNHFLEIDHAKIVIEALAYVHGLSIAAEEKEPSIKTCFKHGYFCEAELDYFRQKCKSGILEMAEDFKKIPSFQKYVWAIKKVAPFAIEIFQKSNVVNPNPNSNLNALIHTDCWTGNLLFSKDEARKKIKKLCLIDFQMIHWGPVIFDLIFFMYSSLSPDTIDKYKSELLKIYSKTIQNLLEDFGINSEPFSLTNILEEMQYFRLLPFILVINLLKFFYLPIDMFRELEKLGKKFEISSSTTNHNKDYQETLLKHFVIFEKEGLFDFIKLHNN